MYCQKTLIAITLWALSSVLAFADASLYGSWYCEGGNGTEYCVTLNYVNSESRQHDVVYGKNIPCYGYLQFAIDMDSPQMTYLISECEEVGNGARVAVFSQDEDRPTGCYVVLHRSGNTLKIENQDGDDSSIGEYLDGLELTQSATMAELVKANDVFEGDVVAEETEIVSQPENVDDEVSEEAETYDATVTDSCQDTPSYWGSEKMKSDLTGIGILLLYLAIIGHMIYVLFIRKSVYPKHGYSLEEMIQARAASGKSAELSDAEYDTLNRLWTQSFSNWTVDPNNEDNVYPTKLAHIKEAESVLLQMAEIQPADQEVVDKMNELVEVINSNTKRQFNGSTKLIILTVIVAALLTWMAGTWQMLPFFVISLAIYYGASLTPTWLLNKKALSGKQNSNFSTGVIAAILAFVGSAQTIRTTTLYSDGTKDVSDDHSQHWIFLMIGIILLFLLAFFIAVWAIYNYVRNYLLYI